MLASVVVQDYYRNNRVLWRIEHRLNYQGGPLKLRYAEARGIILKLDETSYRADYRLIKSRWDRMDRRGESERMALTLAGFRAARLDSPRQTVP